jgi:hypothetical protein
MGPAYNWVCPTCETVNAAGTDVCQNCHLRVLAPSFRSTVKELSVFLCCVTFGVGFFIVRAYFPYNSAWSVGAAVMVLSLVPFGVFRLTRRRK